jgi:superfamily II DNA/RNA helicase
VSFETLNLHPSILKALQDCGYAEPTAVQAQAIPLILEGRDLIASAQTGTGKTAAFVLPALQHLINSKQNKNKAQPFALILTPTRELANQITDAIRDYGKNMRSHTVNLVGGISFGWQIKQLSRPVDFIVATPGRLLDHLNRRHVDLSGLQLLVLDEADRMLDMGFIDEVEKIVTYMPEERQTLMFTATWDDKLAQLASHLLHEPERIRSIETKMVVKNIQQRFHVVDNFEHKNRMLQHLLTEEEITQAIVFSATKRGADELAQKLIDGGHAAAALHGDMNQVERNRTLVQMRRGKVRVLVATDVAARGLDVDGVSHVINFDLPRFAEDYVHRIGRTGRAGASGTAISLVLPDDVLHLERIEKYTGESVPHTTIPGLEPKHNLLRRSMKKSRAPTRGGGAGRGAPKAGGYATAGASKPRRAAAGHGTTTAAGHGAGHGHGGAGHGGGHPAATGGGHSFLSSNHRRAGRGAKT